MSKVYGYARCSTNEDTQDINRQIRELKAAGAEEVVFEYEHGDAKVKQNLNMLLDAAQEGDTIITLEASHVEFTVLYAGNVVNHLLVADVLALGMLRFFHYNGQTHRSQHFHILELSTRDIGFSFLKELLGNGNGVRGEINAVVLLRHFLILPFF